MAGIKRIFLLSVGSLSAALGFLGIFLPLLPTTPFLLLAAFCYARSSERAYTWLRTNRWFGEYLRNYQEGRGLSRGHKISAISLLWTSIGSTVVWVVSSWWLALMLIGIALGVTVHVIKLPSTS
jgi:uncharacterized protein